MPGLMLGSVAVRYGSLASMGAAGIAACLYAGVASAQAGVGACHTLFCESTRIAMVLLLAVAVVWSLVLRFRRGGAVRGAPVSFGGKLLLGLVTLAIILLSLWSVGVSLSGNA